MHVCDHNEKLASHDRKNIFHFVTIFFFYFGADSLGVFFYCCNISIMAIEKTQKNAEKYECIICDFFTCNKFDYRRHIKTNKHQMRESSMTYGVKPMKSNKKTQDHICNVCNTIYKDPSGLWRHKKKCGKVPTNQGGPVSHSSSDDMQTNLILELVKQNQDFKDLLIQQSNQLMEQNKTIIEVAKNSQINNNNTINQTNSHNKTFNLQFFLNETCKDAMNMKDFIKSLELTMPELEKMGELGFAEGMSRLFVNRLNSMDITKRPIHCSDVKREIIHIKDDNKWERDNANLDRLRKIIKQITHRNIVRVDDWKQANPGCTDYNSRKYDHYLKLTMETIGPIDDVGEKRDFGKIIRRVAENTTIDKKYLCM